MEYEKIVLVTRKTRLDGLVERFNTRAQARFYLEHNGLDFSIYEREHETYYAALAALRSRLLPIAKVQEIERSFLPNFVFAETDLVVAIGVDGLVVNTAKYLDGQPLIAVNPDPAHIDGILLPFTVGTAPQAVLQVLKGQFHERQISMAEARLNDGQSLLAFNDLFIGVRSHISARYRLRWQEQEEDHSSSGIIVSTGAGSTGWLSSLFNMANGLLLGFSPAAQPLQPMRLPWDADQLVFVVREPFISKTSRASITCGMISPDSPLYIESQMPEGGVIFSDGVEADFLAFNAGAIATVGLAKKKTRLIVPAP
ncbi:MAG: hypothetical protein ABWK53_09605 [Anaerolineales bacterium]